MAVVLIVACGRFGEVDSILAGGLDGAAVPTDASASADGDGGTTEGPCPYEDAAACAVHCDPDGGCQSCLEIKLSRPDAGSGLYAIVGAADPTIDVYCDMTTRGGGWTLAGRSEDQGDLGDFGWFKSNGDPSSDVEPYSLDLGDVKLTPTEILFGARGPGRTWGANVYLAKLPAGFPVVGTDEALSIRPSVQAVAGTCAGGDFQGYIGFAGREDVFFFRDNAEDGAYGLDARGWTLNGESTCERGGLLDGEDGMIFVR